MSQRPQPEAKLLRHCARTRVDAANAEAISLLVLSGLDWTKLVKLAQRHSVLPLLYQSLNTTCPDAVPEAVLTQLKRRYQANALRNRSRTAGLLDLLKLLKGAGIRAMPYKGPVLAACVYGDVALRQFRDVDILVPESQAAQARTLLLAQGYRQKSHFSGPKQAVEHAYKFVPNEHRLIIELHWAVVPGYISFPLNFERLWARRQPADLVDTTVQTLRPEDLLLVLCVHGHRHNWRQLSWICDVAEFLQANPELDWAWTVAQATTLGGQRILWLGVALAKELLAAPLPPVVAAKIEADPQVSSLVARVSQGLFHTGELPGDEIERYFLPALTRERWRDRIPYLWQLMRHRLSPNDKDRALVSLPAMLSFLYYLIRPLRLAKAYGLTLAKRLWAHLFYAR